MAFRLSYSFEGNYRHKPEQNLSGASKKNTRDLLLQRAHEERQKRHDERLKLKSTNILQSYFRSYLVRKHVKDEMRASFDGDDDSNIRGRLSKLLFFYYYNEDKERFLWVCQLLINYKGKVLLLMEKENDFNWLIKRFLRVCLKFLTITFESELPLQCLNDFIGINNIEYLIKREYYRDLRLVFNTIDNSYSHINMLIKLVMIPFELYSSIDIKQTILSTFCTNFLSNEITEVIKTKLIPPLALYNCVPFNDLINYLNGSNRIVSSTHLLYVILSLEPDNYMPNAVVYLKVLSRLTNSQLWLQYGLDSMELDDSDMEDFVESQGIVRFEEIVALLNNEKRIHNIDRFYLNNSGDDELVLTLAQIFHNLLMAYKKSIKKFTLVYWFALKGSFLSRLWSTIQKYDPKSLRDSGTGSLSTVYTLVSVFCKLFCYFTYALTESEAVDTSEVFSLRQYLQMSDLLRDLALNVIDAVFPMCYHNSATPCAEMIFLYENVNASVKTLYTLNLRKKFCGQNFWTNKNIAIPKIRSNYLDVRLEPYTGLTLTAEDKLPPLSTIEQRSLAVIKELPFLVDFNQRVKFLRRLCAETAGSCRFANEFHVSEVITIRRTHLYEDAFEKISQKASQEMRVRLRIQFINSAGLEEAGIDGGGIFKEFLNEVLRTAFDPNRGFFLMTADNTLYPNPNVHLIVDNYTDHFYFIGRLIGKAIFENILVDLPLAEFFVAKILVDRTSYHFLRSLDPVLFRNLLYLRDYKGNVQELGLDFTLASNDLGKTSYVELKPNGTNIAVTNANRLEYIHKLANLKLNTQLKKQCRAFKEGINSVVPLSFLQLFDYKELQTIISGDNQEIDIDDLRANTVYGGEFTADHPTILMFWKVLGRFTNVQKGQFLKFVTSCSRPPLLGFKELNPSFGIQSSGGEDRMPTASTCLNLLKLPVTKDEENLRNKLLNAIEQQAGFELS